MEYGYLFSKTYLFLFERNLRNMETRIRNGLHSDYKNPNSVNIVFFCLRNISKL